MKKLFAILASAILALAFTANSAFAQEKRLPLPKHLQGTWTLENVPGLGNGFTASIEIVDARDLENIRGKVNLVGRTCPIVESPLIAKFDGKTLKGTSPIPARCGGSPYIKEGAVLEVDIVLEVGADGRVTAKGSASNESPKQGEKSVRILYLTGQI